MQLEVFNMVVTRLQTLTGSGYCLWLLNPHCHILLLLSPSCISLAQVNQCMLWFLLPPLLLHRYIRIVQRNQLSCTSVIAGWSTQITSACHCLVWQIITLCDRTENNDITHLLLHALLLTSLAFGFCPFQCSYIAQIRKERWAEGAERSRKEVWCFTQ